MTNSKTMPFFSFRELMIQRYGEPVHRVPLDLGFGCPHRNADGSGGCAFCAADGSRAAQIGHASTIPEQVCLGVAFAQRRYGARRFMAYIQAFTGTFAPVDTQRKVYEEILAAHPFDALSIGTRPDCLPATTVNLLSEFQRRLDVWVELGVQTVHNRTLKKINRGHDWETSRQAILRLAEAGLNVLVHVILGLPGESMEDFRTTAEAIGSLPVMAIKIHNLHVLRGTPLAEEYLASPFPVFDEHQYADILIDFLRRLPSRMAIARLNTDTPDDRLVAPKWKWDKSRFRQFVVSEMQRRGVCQGDLARPPNRV
ncbi:MAG: TIGR01212 family radical SAM protein [Kiritimatiellae bacterium]|nr:TIGR01212 family radical SAM protein [Kiritimatiellia bacterium]